MRSWPHLDLIFLASRREGIYFWCVEPPSLWELVRQPQEMNTVFGGPSPSTLKTEFLCLSDAVSSHEESEAQKESRARTRTQVPRTSSSKIPESLWELAGYFPVEKIQDT